MNEGSNYEVGDLVRYRRNSYDEMSEWRASRVGLIQGIQSRPIRGPLLSRTYSVLWSDRPTPETVSQWDLEIIYEEPR